MENEEKPIPTDENQTLNIPQSSNATDSNGNEDHWCFAWYGDAPPPEPGTAARATLINAAKWIPSSTITVSFLDGDPEVQERVKKVAREWVTPGPANLILDFRKNTTKTDIRISFRFAGSWSMVGTTCRNITDVTQPTMNYGWLTKQSSDDELRRVVLHEFGHALGLTHEHMNPGGKINWNREQVIKELSGPPNNWTLQQIENNMFRTFDKQETNYTKLDKDSIMMYPIPKKWTQDGFSVDLNTELSPTDKSFIRQQYS